MDVINSIFIYRHMSHGLDLFWRVLLQKSIFLWFMERWSRKVFSSGCQSSQYTQSRRKCLCSKPPWWGAFLVGPHRYQLWRDVCVEWWNFLYLSLLGKPPAKQLQKWRLCPYSWVSSWSWVQVEWCQLLWLSQVHLQERCPINYVANSGEEHKIILQKPA